MVKNPYANAGDIRHVTSSPGLGRSPGRGSGKPLQFSCLENPMDRVTWQGMVHGVTKSQVRLKRLSMQEVINHKNTLESLSCTIICDNPIYF